MTQTTKQPANWIHSFNVEGGRVYVSDKGALKLVTIQPNGMERFLMCLMPAQATFLANAAGDIGNFLISDEYKAIEHNKELNKEKNKIASQMVKHQEVALRKAQAAIEELQRLGLKVDDLGKASGQ